MSCCNNTLKNPNYKSAVRAYNATAQPVVAAGTRLAILGQTCTDTGCALTAGTNAVTVNAKGLYYFSADVTLTSTAAGVAIVQLYNGTTALPCAISQQSVAIGGIATLHVETELYLNPCCNVAPQINIQASGVAATVNWVGMTAEKRA